MGNSVFVKLAKKIGKFPGFLLEFSIDFFLLWGMIFYIGQRISVIFSSPCDCRVLLSLIFAGTGLLMNSCYRAKNKYLHYIGIISLWALVILMIATLILALEQLLHPSIKVPGTFIITLILAVLFRGFVKNRKIIITPLIIKSSKIQKDRTLIFISDLHVDLIHNRHYLRRIIDKILKEKPSMVFIWGDLVDVPQEHYIACFQEFQRIKVPIYAIIGNHDVHFGTDTRVIEKVFKMGKITPLRNQSIRVGDLQLVGIDDKELWGKKELNSILEECKMQSGGLFTIFLSHRPLHLSKLAKTPIDLELAGHTHNGQVRGLHFLSYLINDYTYGKFTWKGKTAFTSQGVGTRTPIRLGTEGEIVVIHLISQN